jgi:hypothetical protein
MKPPQERLNDRLEQLITSADSGLANGSSLPSSKEELEIDKLVDVARRLQATPQLQVSTDFAALLERRMLRHYLEQRRKTAHSWSFLRLLRLHPALTTTISLCLLLLLFSTGILAIAAQATNPNSPLYGIKQWEQHVQYKLTTSPADQAELDLQLARDRLKTLAHLTGPADSGKYLQALSDFDQKFSTATNAIKALPAGSRQTQLANELSTLQQDARQELRGFLPKLTINESLATTTELSHLGEQIPLLTSATLLLSPHPNKPATISIVGKNIQSGAQLLIDGKHIQVTGTLHDGQIVFVLNWNGNQHPQSLGILNPNGTAAQTSSITLKNSNENANDDKKRR